jgi:hypothetical protein
MSGDRPNGERRVGIHARTASRWLRRLRYKWQEAKEGVFLNSHEMLDVVEYRKRFLDEV